jgi:hypothetical protein
MAGAVMLREESSVSPRLDEFGELCFPGSSAQGAIVTRTPEELGLSRVVANDAPGGLMPWIDRGQVIRVRKAREERAVGERAKKLAVELASLDRDLRGGDSRGRDLRGKSLGGRSPARAGRAERGRKGAARMNGELAIESVKPAVSSKRYRAPQAAVVAMDQVPEPELGRVGYANVLWPQLAALKPGAALKVVFEAAEHGGYIRGRLGALARKRGRVLLSSKAEGGKVRWFWLEKQ